MSTIVRTPRSINRFQKFTIKHFGSERERAQLAAYGITFKRAPDGLRTMHIITSNSYTDRENEVITTQALSEYVRKSWQGDTFVGDNALHIWHDGDPIGEIIWADMEGAFLIEVAKELPNRVIRLTTDKASPFYKVKTTVKAVWDALERSDVPLGASHGFKYPDGAKADNTYHAIEKFETSVLPLDAAANPYTLAEVK
jgi:hypothetical protein